ncbi:MAG: hypothetical protein AB7M93_26120 [Candidatus Obscuribacterales bacterium]
MSDEDSQDPKGQVQLNLRIGITFADRLKRHILSVERMEGKRVTKQQWIEAAIREKLEKEKHLHPADIGKEPRLSLKLVESLSREIDEKVDFMRKFRSTYSKKQWVVEAIEEKLAQEARSIARWYNETATEGNP